MGAQWSVSVSTDPVYRSLAALSDGTPVLAYYGPNGMTLVYVADHTTPTTIAENIPCPDSPNLGWVTGTAPILCVDASDNIYLFGVGVPSSGGSSNYTNCAVMFTKGSGYSWTQSPGAWWYLAGGTVADAIRWVTTSGGNYLAAAGGGTMVSVSESAVAGGGNVGLASSVSITNSYCDLPAPSLGNPSGLLLSNGSSTPWVGTWSVSDTGQVTASRGVQLTPTSVGPSPPMAVFLASAGLWLVVAVVSTSSPCVTAMLFSPSGAQQGSAVTPTVVPNGVCYGNAESVLVADPTTPGLAWLYGASSSTGSQAVSISSGSGSPVWGTGLVTLDSTFDAGSLSAGITQPPTAYVDYIGVGGSLTGVGGDYATYFTAPAAPTLQAPGNAAYVDVSQGQTFTAGYNSTDYEAQNAYAFEIAASGGAYSYYNAATGALQSTVVWNPVSTPVGGTFSATLPASAISNGTAYQWSFASQEAGANLQGPFASPFTLNAQANPTVVVTAPTGTQTTANPTVTWTATPAPGASITAYRVVIYSAAQYGASGFTPGSGPSAFDTGVLAGNPGSTTVPLANSLANYTSYRAYVQVTESGGETSTWQYSAFTEAFDFAATPTLVAFEGTDSTTGCPLVLLAVQGHDNLLSFADASFETGVGTWAGAYDATVAQTSAAALDGDFSLAIQTVVGGRQAVSTVEWSGAYPVLPGNTYTFVAAFQAVSALRTPAILAYWSTDSGTVGTLVEVAQEVQGGWVVAAGAAVAPTGATTVRFQVDTGDFGSGGQPTGQLSAPAAPTVTVEGTTGSTSYSYEVCATNAYGSTPPSSETTVTNGNATLSSTDYNLVEWSALPLPAGSEGNLVYDSLLENAIASVGPTWSFTTGNSAGTIGTADGDWNVASPGTLGAEIVYYGTGSAAPAGTWAGSTPIAVTPGATMTLSALMNGANLLSGSSMSVEIIYNGNLNNTVGSITVTAGEVSLQSLTFTVPTGATTVSVIPWLSLYGAASGATAGDTLTWSYLSLVEGSAPANLVFDSTLVAALESSNPSWALDGTVGTASGDQNAIAAGTPAAEFVYYGTGAASAALHYTSSSIAVTPGDTYYVSCLLDATQVSAGEPYLIVLTEFNGTVLAGPFTITAGTAGQVGGSFTVPTGTTQCVVQMATNGATVDAGGVLGFSEIQLTETSTAQPYAPGIVPQAGPLWTYDVYRNGALIGSTTSLGFEDTGQAAGAAPPTANTSGETHLVDEAGVFPGSPGYDLIVLNDGAIAYWPLDDTPGSTTAHNLLSETPGQVNGGVRFGQPGVVAAFPSETAASFDGSTGYLTLPAGDPSTVDFSVECWINAQATQTGNPRLVMDGNNSNNGFSLLLNDGSTPGLYVNGTGPVGGTISYNEPHHVVGVVSGTTATVYLDGTVVASGRVTPLVATSGLEIGRGSYGADYFAGTISNVAIYPYALSAQQVANHYQAASATGSLVQRWSRGGLVGQTSVAILRSDGLYVRNASMANPLTIPSPSEEASVSDYELTPTVPYTYTAVVSAPSIGISSLPSAPTSSITVTTTQWWELDPTNPSTAVNAQVTSWSPQQNEQATQHFVLGQQTAYVVANAMMSQDFDATFELFDPDIYSRLEALLTSQQTIFVSSPWGKNDTGYFRFGPQSGMPGGGGMGQKVKDTSLMPSTSSGPHRTVQVTAVAQPRPPV